MGYLYCLMDRLESAVLDLAADDSGGLQKQKSTYHWDKVWTIPNLVVNSLLISQLHRFCLIAEEQKIREVEQWWPGLS